MLNLIGSLIGATFMAIMPISTDYNNLNYSRDKTADPITKFNSIEKDENFFENINIEKSNTLSFWNGCGSGNYELATVYTPNGSEVEVIIDKSNLSKNGIASRNSRGDNKVPQATRISDSSNKYNCHSYAWYQQSANNPYWMNDPSAYYTDGSYYQVYTPNINDRICYFDKSGINIHSGIIIDKYSGTSNGVCGNSNLVKVVSKWGELGLYEHRGDQCPYTSTYDGSAVTIKYYHRHNYTNHYSNINTSQHVAYCVCGDSITENHKMKYKKTDSTLHRKSCACGMSSTEEHYWTPYADPLMTKPGSYVQCKHCYFIKKLGANEIIPILPFNQKSAVIDY